MFRRAARMANAAGRTAAVAMTILAVLAFAATHVEADHAPPPDAPSVATAAVSGHSSPHGDGGFSGAECSTPCAATTPAAAATRRVALSSPPPVLPVRESLFGAELARSTPPPRFG